MFQNFILHLFEHKGMLISSHNLHYIWICPEKQKIFFSKIAFFIGLEKKCFCKTLVKNLFEWIQTLTQNYVGIILSAQTLL